MEKTTKIFVEIIMFILLPFAMISVAWNYAKTYAEELTK